MRFLQTPLPGVWLVELELLGDERGWFARTFDTEEFRSRDVELRPVRQLRVQALGL